MTEETKRKSILLRHPDETLAADLAGVYIESYSEKAFDLVDGLRINLCPHCDFYHVSIRTTDERTIQMKGEFLGDLLNQAVRAILGEPEPAVPQEDAITILNREIARDAVGVISEHAPTLTGSIGILLIAAGTEGRAGPVKIDLSVLGRGDVEAIGDTADLALADLARKVRTLVGGSGEVH